MQIDISNLAYIAGDVLGIGEFAGGVFCVFALFIVSFVILSTVMGREKMQPLAIMIDGVLVAGLGLALGWVDIWLPALMVLCMIFFIMAKGTGGLGSK